MNSLEVSIHNLAVYGLGIFALFVLSVTITAVIWNFVAKKYRNGNGNRRVSDARDWSVNLNNTLLNLNNNLTGLSGDIKELKLFLKNGFSENFKEISQAMHKCHELNAIKEHDLLKKND